MGGGRPSVLLRFVTKPSHSGAKRAATVRTGRVTVTEKEHLGLKGDSVAQPLTTVKPLKVAPGWCRGGKRRRWWWGRGGKARSFKSVS
jgi:hypothetical protein